MAISREQAILELLLEIGDTLKGFDEVERQYEQTVSALRSATDKADIDRLSRDAREARDSMARLSREGQAQLRKLADSGQLASNEYKELRVNIDRLEDAIAQADRELAQFNRRGREVGTLTSGVRNLQRAWVAVGSVVASIGITRVLRSIIEETREAEQAQAQIRQAIVSTGGAAGVTAEEMYDMARGLQAVTTFGDDTILGMQSLLLTFTSLRRSELPEITERVLDVATALAAGGGGGGQIDLRSAAVQVGKALQDPIRGITALRRSSIDFTEAQQAQIKVLVESNRLYEAQRIILDSLAEQVGGRSRAAANTFAGAMDQARETAKNLLEEVGSQGLSRELAILSRLFTESAEGGSSFGRSLGQTIAFVVSLAGRLVQAFEVARGAVAVQYAGILGAGRLMASGLFAVFSLVERTIEATVRRIASLIPETDLPGQIDDNLRKFAGRVGAGLEAGRAEAERKRAEIVRELQLLAESFAKVAGERFGAAAQIGRDLERIRAELEAAGAAAAGGFAGGLGEGEDALKSFRDELFGSRAELELAAKNITALVDSLGGLTNATPAQAEKIRAEVQKIVDGFALVGERPPVALEILAKSMGVTASAVKAEADKATAALKEMIGAAEEAARIPASRFSADLELDEGTISEELAEVQARLAEMRSGLLIDPAEEQALLEREADLLIDLSRAQRAWTDVQVDSNREQGEAIGLGEEHTRILRDLGLLTEDWAAGMGLAADDLADVNQRLADSTINTGLLFDNVEDAAAVTLPALSEAQLQAARDSGMLDASLEAIADRLLVTAGNAEQQGAALQAAGEQAAAGQREAARETETAGEQVESLADQTDRALKTAREYAEFMQTAGPAIREQWAGIRAEADGAAAACERLASCSGAR